MKRTLTVLTAALFASVMALPAFAQVGAGVAGNATVGESNNHIGANADVANSDAERAEPTTPTDVSPKVVQHHGLRSENPTENPSTIAPDTRRGVDANAALKGDLGRRADAGARTGTDDSPTGGY
jgi:hypothetical protein